MSLSSLGSLASTAFDTARTTLKAMADAAVPPATEKPAATPTAPAAPPSAGSQAVPSQAVPSQAVPYAAASPGGPEAAASAATKPKPAKGQRIGTVLDAYA